MRLTSKHLSIPSSEITSETTYLNRRQLLRSIGLTGVGLAGASPMSSTHAASTKLAYQPIVESKTTANYLKQAIKQRQIATTNPLSDELTPWEVATTYNNYYEFGTAKSDPAENAGTLTTHPWSVTIDGLCANQGTFHLEDILKKVTLEDRIYRFRCVEAWSMAVPWLGFPLRELIKRAQPNSDARFIRFETLYSPEQMPLAKRASGIPLPYVEGLRLDEAIHPLTILAVGLYGRSLPNQNGAPLRLIVPWKYGFKSIKSIVRITFTKSAPISTWMRLAPQEYGFYANVNPKVSHPRWSQARERRLPNTLFNPNWTPTLPFNGYGKQVAPLYAKMNLQRYY